MCADLEGSGATVNMDNYYISATTAIQLKERKIYCRGTIRSTRKYLPKSILFSNAETQQLPRGYTWYAVNNEHQIVAIGWMDSKPVNVISTADTTEMGFVRRGIGNTKVDVEAPEAIVNYNKYMGGVNKHDRLQNSWESTTNIRSIMSN
jgi:hypothetical protein